MIVDQQGRVAARINGVDERREAALTHRPMLAEAKHDDPGRGRPLAAPLLYLLFFLSGAAALAYEVLWMRRFAVLLGATAPAVAAALAAFFAGLGLGSYLLGRFAPRLTRPLRVFAILEIATGLSALVVDPLRRLRPLCASLY